MHRALALLASFGAVVFAGALLPAAAHAAAPVNTVPPAISGTAVDLNKLTTTNGTWTGAPISYTRRWLRCDVSGNACVPVGGATGTSYTLTSADVGATIRSEIVAANADGAAVATSAPTAVVAPAPPVSTAAPTVTGAAKEGTLLTATSGTWKGTSPITLARQWERCEAGTCAPIAGETGPTYRLTADDVGRTVRVTVTATNVAGSAVRASSQTQTVTGSAPQNVEPPTVSGALARDGVVWTSTLGTWAGTATIVYNRQWLRCASNGSSCTPISGEVGPTYTLSSADVGRTVRIRVYAANGLGTVVLDSAPSPVIAPAPPAPGDGTPAIDGVAQDGRTLTATGVWTGTPPVALTYQWQRCDALTLVCADIPGATGQTYRLVAADVGAHVRVRVGASNAGGGASATSAMTALVAPAPPGHTAPPTLTGTAREGETLEIDTSAFTGTPPLSFTAQWERCDTAGEACAPIPGATGLTRVLDAADRGATLRAVVTATNGVGSDTVATPPSPVVAAAPPAGTVLPAITPATGLKDGVLLTVSDGGWTGSQPMTISYQWLRCDAAGAACAPIAGATQQTYRLVTADVGRTIRAVVTATNMAGSAGQTTLATGVVGTNPPVNTSPPGITGVARDGQTLHAEDGTWTGIVPFTTTYQWLRCDAAGENCGAVDGATSAVYTLGPDDVGLTLRVQVMQTSAGGSTAATSPPSDVVLAAPPVNVAPPAVIGRPGVGRTLTAHVGTWTGTPELRFSYRWQRCQADGSACVDIADATASTYVLVPADDGATVRVVVTAANDEGSVTVASPTTAEISDDPPVLVDPPVIQAEGLVAQGRVLTVTDGVWAGATPMEHRYQWRRCDPVTLACVDIAGATASSYRLTADDVGRRIVARVTVENAVDAASADTDPTPVVLVEPPANAARPAVTAAGGLQDGAKLSASAGSWTGAAPLAYTYAWLRCDADGGLCEEIPGQVAPTYVLGAEDVGRRIRVRVTAANAAASVSAESDATAVVAPAPPRATVRPAVSVLDGRAQVGARVKASPGTWEGTAPVDLQMRWQRCLGSSLGACEDVPGATDGEYVLTQDDVGRRLRVVVTATNAAGTATAESLTTETVPPVPPENLSPPAIAGGPLRQGATLSASAGTWSGSPTIVHAFQWERCPAPGASCQKIAGAVRSTYTLTAADVAKVMRVTVTASNGGGRVSASSDYTGEVHGIAPANVEEPTATLKGEVKVGTAIASTNGRWTGTEKMTFTQRWQRCDATGAACVDIPGATKATYTLTDADVTKANALRNPIRVVVTASNGAGRAEAASALVTNPRKLPAAGSASTSSKAGATKATRKRPARARSAAALTSIRLTPAGRLLVRLTCPKRSKDRCGARGSVAAGRIRQGLSTDAVAKGRSVTKSYRLTAVQRRWLRGRRAVTFTVRLAAPATPTRARVTKKRVTVPAKLRGKAAERKAAKRRTTTARRATTSARTTTPRRASRPARASGPARAAASTAAPDAAARVLSNGRALR